MLADSGQVEERVDEARERPLGRFPLRFPLRFPPPATFDAGLLVVALPRPSLLTALYSSPRIRSYLRTETWCHRKSN